MVALEIAKRGGAVHLVCRDKQREDAVKEIKQLSNNEVSFLAPN